MNQATKQKRSAAIIGGGVIGGGWAARFLLQGWNVSIFDPDPDAERKIAEVLANAERSLPHLSDSAMPVRGQLQFAASIEHAVQNAEWIQESVPERLDIKHRAFADILDAAPPNALIGSSTSGFKPSELQQGAAEPQRILVAHPFNPVYLLPLVELVPGDAGSDENRERAMQILSAIGMKPLWVRKEIDAHIADRFLEAVWREGLWLINDDIATTTEIDDAIRYGFGLRWAQMGLFETYRIAGGEAGMAHFIAQFGPCLSWPWTKLMDVPELTDELVKKIADQSDEQSGQYSIRELERIRDDNLIGILQALKSRNWGAGQVLRELDQSRAQAEAASRPDERSDSGIDLSKLPLSLTQGEVLAAWLDDNSLMTEHRYLSVFSDTSDALFAPLGSGNASLDEGHSLFTLETHIRHLSELAEGQVWHTTTQVLSLYKKTIKLFHSLYATETGTLAATAEQIFLHVDMQTKSATPFSPQLKSRLQKLMDTHASLPSPEGAGRYVGQAL